MEKYQEIVRAHDSFDMKLKRVVPGGGAALLYTAHFRCAQGVCLPTRSRLQADRSCASGSAHHQALSWVC